jgi:hypothetical protein
MTVNAYLLGSMVTLTGRFYSDAAKTIPADPTTVVLSIRDPNRAITTPAVVNAGVGIRTYAWTPLIAGMHEINWTGTGAVVSADQEPIYVNVGINLGQLYLSPDQLKSTLTMTGTSFADADVTLAIGAASRAVDSMTGRRFWLDTGTANVRYYTPQYDGMTPIDDLVVMTSVAIDSTGTGAFTETWTSGTDFVLEPFNAPLEQPARPYNTLRARYRSGRRWLPSLVEQSIKVTGQFGWPSIPDDVTAATGILAAKLLRRGREAPFGIVTAGIDSGATMRIARTDPDVSMLLGPYARQLF